MSSQIYFWFVCLFLFKEIIDETKFSFNYHILFSFHPSLSQLPVPPAENSLP